MMRTGGQGEITDLLHAWHDADPQALARLMPQVVDDLRRLARRHFVQERGDHTLEPTALVNEVYLRMNRLEAAPLVDRNQFFAFAAHLMRRILVDHARARNTGKRGGELVKVPLEHASNVAGQGGVGPETLILLDEALDQLEALDPRQRAVVEMRYFAGLKLPEIAEVLGVSLPTVERAWTVARRFLAREVGPSAGRSPGR